MQPDFFFAKNGQKFVNELNEDEEMINVVGHAHTQTFALRQFLTSQGCDVIQKFEHTKKEI